MILTAKFDGRCRECGGVVRGGEQCEWERGEGVKHLRCPEVIQATVPRNNHANGNGDSPKVTVTMGVFRKDGRIYVVKPNKEKTRCYAKEIIASPPRMTEAGEVVDFESVYRAGVVYNLTEADRWPLAEAAEFLTQYSRCIVCGRHLKAAASVARSIGPICAGYFG